MTTQENVDKLIGLVGKTITELTAMQLVLEKIVTVLIAEKGAIEKDLPLATVMTIEERRKLVEEQICPDCGCKTFYDRPQDGIGTNITCVDCGSKFRLRPFFADRIY